jgi:pterin-4a-carbinolamine dehydratase
LAGWCVVSYGELEDFVNSPDAGSCPRNASSAHLLSVRAGSDVAFRPHQASGRGDEASTHFRTESFAAGVALVNAIGRLGDDANHHPDVDLRPDGVTVRLRTESVGGLSEHEVVLARQISEAARELGVPVDLTGPQIVQVAIDALVIPDVLPFWRAVLGYREVDDEDLIDPPLPGTAVLVPTDGRAAPAAQQDPHRSLRAPRPGGGSRRGGDRRRWPRGQRRERAGVVDPGRRRRQRGRRRQLAGPRLSAILGATVDTPLLRSLPAMVADLRCYRWALVVSNHRPPPGKGDAKALVRGLSRPHRVSLRTVESH